MNNGYNLNKWTWKTLGDIASSEGYGLVDGPFGSDLPASCYTKSGIPVIRGSNLALGIDRFVADEFVYISEETASRLKRSLARPNDIIFTKKGTIGQTGLIPNNLPYNVYLISSNQIKLTVDDSLADSVFVYYYVSSKASQEKIKRDSEFTGVPKTNTKYLRDFQIYLPPLSIQKQIATTLDTLDLKIENLRKQNETLELIAQTLFKHWFIDFEFPNADAKPYKSSGGAMVASELGDIPEGWKVGTLESEVEIQKGVSYKGEGLADSITGIPMHNLKSVYEGGGYRHDGIKFYNGDYKERHICKIGDIIVPNTEQGEKHKLIGFPARIPRYFKDVSILTHHLFKVIPLRTSYFSRQYIYYLITSHITRKQIIGYTNGTTVNMLSPDGFKKPLVVKPDKNIIKSFTQVVNPIWEKQESNFDQLQTLTKTRDSLLPKLMSGQLRVKE